MHRAAMAGAAITLGLTGALAAGTSAVAAPSTVSRVTPDTHRYIGLYENYRQCQGGGEYFMRHGATYYKCYEVSAGYELHIWE